MHAYNFELLPRFLLDGVRQETSPVTTTTITTCHEWQGKVSSKFVWSKLLTSAYIYGTQKEPLGNRVLSLISMIRHIHIIIMLAQIRGPGSMISCLTSHLAIINLSVSASNFCKQEIVIIHNIIFFTSVELRYQLNVCTIMFHKTYCTMHDNSVCLQ